MPLDRDTSLTARLVLLPPLETGKRSFRYVYLYTATWSVRLLAEAVPLSDRLPNRLEPGTILCFKLRMKLNRVWCLYFLCMYGSGLFIAIFSNV